MTIKTPHLHAAFLVEALKDVTREIEGKHIRGFFWEKVSLTHVVTATELWEFRFAHKVVSSLSDDELCEIVDQYNDSNEDIDFRVIRAIADAAAARHDADINKTSIDSKNPRVFSNIV